MRRLSDQQKAMIESFIEKYNLAFIDYDIMKDGTNVYCLQLIQELEKINWYESFWSDFNRYGQDYITKRNIIGRYPL